MSAIAVVYNLDEKPVSEATLRAVSESLGHRGTDGCGIALSRHVGLVHRLHRTTPESLSENLPQQTSNGLFLITCDARLDNRSELIRQLGLVKDRNGAITDTEIILAAYKKWGEDCAPHLVGDFVFAIWDRPDGKLFAARDPLGVKHFYYYYEPSRLFALASEIKALFKIDNIRRELDEEHLGDFLIRNAEDKEGTFFRGIRRLPATHAMLVGPSGMRIWRYWRPKADEIKLGNDRDYQEAFREKLTEAVVSRLRSDRRPGSFLSGGLDSSAIVCIASDYLKANGKPPLETFSALFPSVARLDSRIDERRFMQSVIDRTGCNAHFITVDDHDPLISMDRIFHHADHPVGAPNVYMDWEIFRRAHACDVRVLLSGIDGDSTVSYGYEDFGAMAIRRMYYRLFRYAVKLRRNIPARKHTIKHLVWRQGIKHSIPPSLVRFWRVVRRRKPNDRQPAPIRLPIFFNAVKPEVRRRLRIEERLEHFTRLNYPSDASPAESHWNGLTGGHFAYTLEQLEKISAAFGIEMRYPFFDRRLVEFCIALPPGQRIYEGWTRSIFRHAMEGIIPREVQWRTDKSNIGASFKINMLKFGLEKIEETIGANSAVLAEYIDMEALRSAYRDYKSDPLNRDGEALFVLSNIYLSNWLREAGFA